jgi:Ribonuclease G/E
MPARPRHAPHEHRVKRYRDDAPLFSRSSIEHQTESRRLHV